MIEARNFVLGLVVLGDGLDWWFGFSLTFRIMLFTRRMGCNGKASPLPASLSLLLSVKRFTKAGTGGLYLEGCEINRCRYGLRLWSLGIVSIRWRIIHPQYIISVHSQAGDRVEDNRRSKAFLGSASEWPEWLGGKFVFHRVSYAAYSVKLVFPLPPRGQCVVYPAI